MCFGRTAGTFQFQIDRKDVRDLEERLFFPSLSIWIVLLSKRNPGTNGMFRETSGQRRYTHTFRSAKQGLTGIDLPWILRSALLGRLRLSRMSTKGECAQDNTAF